MMASTLKMGQMAIIVIFIITKIILIITNIFQDCSESQKAPFPTRPLQSSLSGQQAPHCPPHSHGHAHARDHDHGHGRAHGHQNGDDALLHFPELLKTDTP